MTADALAENVWREWPDEGLPAALAAALHEGRTISETRSRALQDVCQSGEHALATVQVVMTGEGSVRVLLQKRLGH